MRAHQEARRRRAFSISPISPQCSVLAADASAAPLLPPELWRLPRLAFLTARPPALRHRTLRLLRGLGCQHVTVLPGALTHFIGGGRIAARKLVTFRAFRHLLPAQEYVFLGDSGQGARWDAGGRRGAPSAVC